MNFCKWFILNDLWQEKFDLIVAAYALCIIAEG